MSYNFINISFKIYVKCIKNSCIFVQRNLLKTIKKIIMELELHFTCRVEVSKYTPAFSEARPDWGSEEFPASAEFSVYLGNLDITKELPESEYQYIHDKILEDYN